MTGPLSVAKGEQGVLRLFALDMAAEQAHFLKEPGAAAQMLGVKDLDLAQVDIVNTADLTEIGLAGYLAEGFAIPKDQIDLSALAGVTGHVLLVRSRAFDGHALTLKPDPKLSLIATYGEPATDWAGEPLETASAHARPSPRATRSKARRLGAAFFAVTMALVLLIVLWVAT